MNYDVVAVTDCGDMLRVKYVDTYQNSLLKNDELYVKISNVSSDVIRKALSEYKKVCIPKNVNGELSFHEIVVYDTNELERDKLIFLSEVYRRLDYHLFFVSAVDFYDYMSCFNELAARGHFIIDSNRQDKYLEIIESGDESLISALETYLECKDKLDTISYVYKRTKSYEKATMDAETKEDLDKIIESFGIA
jgi:hypothetical protein